MTDFRTLAQLSSDALLVVNDAGTIAYANDAAHDLLAPPGAALAGRAAATLWHPDPRDDPNAWDSQGRLQPLQIMGTSGPAAGAALALSGLREPAPSGHTLYLKARLAQPATQAAPHGLAARVRTALALSTDAAMVVDAQTLAFLDANAAACELMGMTREQVLARGPTHLRRRDGTGTEDFHALYAQLIARSPQALTHEYDFIAGDGRVIPVATTRQALNMDGRWLIFITWLDITARKQEQRRLERITAAFDASGDAIYIIDPDTFTYVDVNEAAARLHGMSRDELRALGVRGAFPDRFDDAGLRARYDDLIARHPQAVTEERQVPRADGRLVWAESIRRAVQVDGQWLVISVMREITERKTAQSRIERLAAVVNMSPDAVMLVDRATMQVIDVNAAACAMHGCTREELMALPVHLTLKDTTRETLEARYDAVIARTPEVVHEEVVERRPDGGTFSAEVRRQALRSDGAWIMVVTVRDLSESKAAQAQLELMHEAINAAPDAIVVIDPHTLEYLDVNEATAQMYGTTREQLLARGARGGIRGDASDAQMRQFYAGIIARAPQACTEEVPTRINGHDVVLEFTRRAVNLNGRWLVVSVNRDITERKAAEAGLRRLKAVVDVAPDGMYIVDAERGEYVDLNHAAGQLYGLTREQVLAMGMTGFMRWLNSHDPEFTLEAVRERHAWLIENHPQVLAAERRVRLPGRPEIVTETLRQAVQVDGRWLILIVVRDITERKAAQARMELLVEAFNVAPDPIVIVDPQNMGYVDVNEAATRLVGLSREDMLSRGLRGVFPQEQAHDGLGNVYQEAIDAAPAVVTRERVVFDAQGNRRILEGTRRAARIDGRWLVVSVTRDITERKAAQQRAERFAAVVNLSADAVFVVDRATLRIIDVNEAACRMYGRDRDAMLSLPPNANRPGMDTTQLEQLYDETIARSPQIHHMEHEALRADGTVFQAETHRMAFQSDGQWLILATVRDITDRKRAEGEIRQRVAELELLREAYNAAVDAILIADPETLAYYDMNDAAVQLLGVSREALLAGGVEASYYSTASEPFDAVRLRKGYRYVISRAPEAVIDVRTIKPLGLGGRDTVIEFSRRGVSVQGRWVVVTLMRDITAQCRAEEEIRQRVAELTRSNQELEQFAYVTSHDLSEPLRMVASYTQLLSRRYADKFDDDGREFIKYAVDGAQRMKQLIDDLLMYSRAGRSRAPMRMMRLDRALDDALANLAHAIERNGATIERGPMPELVCEKAGLTQVFQNLVGNAIKFRGDAAPVVRIAATEDDQFWTLSVADNGIGIAPEYFQRIFIIFQRLHSRSKYEGTGIGLSICKKIVERHGGQITVTCGPGQGTTFSFTLSKSLPESEPS